ncbi:restriction endonuclease subunit S [Arthrobacter sp. H16F315]|uniref:restriction endonuclease subunit S n=1 Tax=Arthrobacter sp. H16F315 TaxID=2955314 RepID=UPI0020972060|nr:restriction endonuclease subunit S [Arthrobacter sp. H16F315]MDD1475472.1 restriction endonuclease subunit S [Arthrobacter sp. H16F315]
MSNWPIKSLGEICREGGGFIRTGPFGSQLHRSDYTEDLQGIPVVMPKDMTRGRINTASVARIDEPTADRLKQHLLSANDIVLARRGDVGRTAWVFAEDLPAFCGTGSMRIHPGESETVRPAFLRFFFHTKLASDYLEGHAVGATMPNLNAGIVERLPVPVPPLRIQDSLIGVLEAFDDLIENNRRRVKVLEEMARATYREWFVKFRYPGHGEVTLVDSALGPIPREWQAGTVGDVVELKYGKALKADARRGGDIAVVSSAGIIGWHDESIVEGPAIVVGRKGNVGSVHWVDGPCWPIDTTYFVQTDLPLRFVAEQLRRTEFTNSHAAVPGLSREGAYARPFLLPQLDLLDSFQALVEPLGSEAAALSLQSEKLTELRDALLPKLVTGQIDVSKLDLDALILEQVAR